MLKRFFVILVLCFFLTPTLVVYADLIAETKNDFYARHESQIVYLGRSFVANGEDGSVAIRYEPGSKNDIGQLKNGEVVYILYFCLYDEDFWGFTNEYSGWVQLDQMLVLYDYVAFEKAHLDELYSYNGDYTEIKEARSAIAWPWPGADDFLWTIEDLDITNFYVTYAYKDEQGREWGFVPYLYGNRNVWVCLSDPLNRDLPVLHPTPKPDLWVFETVHVDIKQYAPENEFPALYVIFVLVFVLVAGTAVLIRMFYKPNQIKSEGKNND